MEIQVECKNIVAHCLPKIIFMALEREKEWRIFFNKMKKKIDSFRSINLIFILFISFRHFEFYPREFLLAKVIEKYCKRRHIAQCKHLFFLWTTSLIFGYTIRLRVWMAWIALHLVRRHKKKWESWSFFYFVKLCLNSQWSVTTKRAATNFKIVIIKIVTKIIK